MDIRKITNGDMVRAENLLRIVSKGQYEFSGQEAMAFTDACMWLGKLIEQMKKEVEALQKPLTVKEVKKPIKEQKKAKSKQRKKKK